MQRHKRITPTQHEMHPPAKGNGNPVFGCKLANDKKTAEKPSSVRTMVKDVIKNGSLVHATKNTVRVCVCHLIHQFLHRSRMDVLQPSMAGFLRNVRIFFQNRTAENLKIVDELIPVRNHFLIQARDEDLVAGEPTIPQAIAEQNICWGSLRSR